MMEKQIEEMANDYYEAMLKARGTLGSMNEGAPKWYAKELYAQGYRKASDVVEVRHGYNKDFDTPSLFECSVCGGYDGDTFTGEGEYKYCPWCGAKMDGERSENTIVADIVREFAERLKAICWGEIICPSTIDRIAKEILEE